jgi:hypothetical protein
MLLISNLIDSIFHAYLYVAAFLIVAMFLEHTVSFYSFPIANLGAPVTTVPFNPEIPGRPTRTATDSESPVTVNVPLDTVPERNAPDGDAPVPIERQPVTEDDGGAIELPHTLKGLQVLIRERGLIDRVKCQLGKSYLRCRKAELIAVLAT